MFNRIDKLGSMASFCERQFFVSEIKDRSLVGLPERQAVASLSVLYAFRMLGLFMVLPVLSLYGGSYSGSSALLMGVALGAYGCSQALLQIPFGMLSDKIGRKPVIAMGLIIFALGSVLAACAESVYELILGRFLQGCGAIASAIMALVSDLTSEENRTKAMASIGASIGLSFSLALVLGPLLAAAGGLDLIFAVTALLAVVGLLVLWRWVPSPVVQERRHREAGAVPELFMATLCNRELLRLNFGIFTLHACLMASFLVLPNILELNLGLDREYHWSIYLPVLLLAFAVMLPFVIVAEKKRKIKPVFVSAVALLAAMLLLQGFVQYSLGLMLTALFLFFVAFNLLEATLPSLVSKVAPAGSKGTAMGLYSTCQFLGAFLGGVAGGWGLQRYSVEAVYWGSAGLALVWLGVAFLMRPPSFLTGVFVSLKGSDLDASATALRSLPGVHELVVIREECAAYLKVDAREFDREAAAAIGSNR